MATSPTPRSSAPTPWASRTGPCRTSSSETPRPTDSVRLLFLVLLCLGAAWARPVDEKGIRDLFQAGRSAPARALLDRQLPQTRGSERGWALLLRVDLDYLLEQPEVAWADIERARKAFGRDPAGRFACRLRDLDRLTRRYDQSVPGLVAELQREYSPAFPERERVHYWSARFAYEVMRGQSRGALRLLDEALAQSTLPDVRASVLHIKITVALGAQDWKQADALQDESLNLWPSGAPVLVTMQMLNQQAQVAEKRDQLVSARTLAVALLTLARGTDQLAYQFMAWHYLRTVAERQGQKAEARRAWDASRTLAIRMPSPPLRAEYLVLLAAPAYPLDVLERELALCWPQLTPELRFRNKLLLGEQLMRYGADNQRGAQIVKQALAEYGRPDDVEAQIQAHMQLARAASERPQALIEYARAYELRRAHPLADPGWARGMCHSAQIANYYSTALMTAGRYADAYQVCRETCELPLSEDERLQTLEQALSAAERAGLPDAVTWAVAEIERGLPLVSPWASSTLLQGFIRQLPASELTPARLARFRDHYRDLLAKLAQVGSPTEIVAARLGQATVLGRLGEPAAQLQSLEQARELARQQGLTFSLRDAQRAILYYYWLGKRWEATLAEARALLADSSSAPLHEVALLAGATAFQMLKQPREALEWLQRREQMLRAQKQPAHADNMLQRMARLSTELKLEEQAVAYYEQMRRSPNLSAGERAVAWAQLGRARRAPQQAAEALDEALATDEPYALTEIAGLAIGLLPQEAARVRERVLVQLTQRSRHAQRDEARNAFLRDEAVRLVRQGQPSEAARLLPAQPSPELAALLSQSAALQEVPELQPFLQAAVVPPSAPEPALGAVLDQLRMARPELGNLLTLRSTNIAEIQAHLGPGQLLVGYYPVGEELYLLGLARDATFQRRLSVGAARLRELVEGLRFSDPTSKGGDNGLSQLLVEPLEPWLEGKTELLTVPTGDIWRVPLAALKLRDGKYLGERVVLSQLSSGDLLRLADGRYQPYRLGAALAVGAPAEVDLPGAARELQAVPGAQVRTSLGPGPWKLVHLATHASFVTKDPLQSYLQLTGQKLTLREIHELKLDPGCLVVLSACESGLGQDHAGSEPVSLATAFSAGGAQAVISGLWRVDDEATALLFQSFYAALQAGRSPGEALQEAQNATRGRYPHPYYWAAFSLLGWPD